MKEKPMSPLPLFALTLVAGALPAAAQDIAGPAANETVNQIIVYGEDRCEPSSPDEIVVCNRLPETDRYRVPEIFRGGDTSPETRRVGIECVNRVAPGGRLLIKKKT